MKFYLIFIIFMGANVAYAQTDEEYRDWVQKQNIPIDVHRAFRLKNLYETYKISFHINPFYLRGDFNGDSKSDIAILIEEIKSGKKGLAIYNHGSDSIFIIGAGIPFYDGRADDFRHIDIWTVYEKAKVGRGMDEGEPPILVGEAILIEKSETSSVLIYWNKNKYDWYWQGD